MIKLTGTVAYSRRMAAAVLLVVLLMPVITWAQAAGSGTVTGVVTRAGSPVAGARVDIGSASLSSYTGSARTDADGNFTISGVPIGGVEIKVYDAQGKFLAGNKASLTTPGQVLRVPVDLPRAATRPRTANAP